jgi:hypothetical protein
MTPIYEPLGPQTRGLVSRHRAYLAPDHLLLLRRLGYREVYRRIEWVDVQGIAVARTATWIHHAWIWLALLVPSVGLAALFDLAGRIFWGLLAAVWLALLVRTLARGPSCRVRLRMPLGWVEVPSWNRLRVARAAFARWLPLVRERQGEIPVEEARARADRPAPSLAQDLPVADAARPLARRQRKRVHRRWHAALAALLFAGIAWQLGGVRIASVLYDLGGLVLAFAALVVSVIAVVVQSGSLLPTGLRRWTVTSLITLAITTLAGAYMWLFLSMALVAVATNSPGTVDPTAGLPDPARTALRIAWVTVSLALGVGWIATRRLPDEVDEADAADPADEPGAGQGAV